MLRAVVGNTTRLVLGTVGIDEETLADATAGVSVSVTRADGTALTTITAASPTSPGSGLYNIDFDADVHLTRTDVLDCVATYEVSGAARREAFQVRVVGGRFFDLRSLRAMQGLTSTSQFSTEDLAAARDVAEEFVEDFTGQAWVPRADVLTVSDTLTSLFLPYLPVRSLVRLEVDGTAAVAADATVHPSGRLELPEGVSASDDVVVEYEHGESTPPADLAQAAKRLARHILFSGDSSIPDRARMMVTDWGTFALDIASEEKPTGLPEVDSVLRRYRFARSVPFA